VNNDLQHVYHTLRGHSVARLALAACHAALLDDDVHDCLIMSCLLNAFMD